MERKPTGTGPLGQSGIEPGSTVEQSFQREFVGSPDPRPSSGPDIERGINDSPLYFAIGLFWAFVAFLVLMKAS